MKKMVSLFFVFAFLANVSAQLKVNASGNVGIGKDPQYKLDVAGDIFFGNGSNIFGTTNSNAITFKVNNVLAGFTGNSANTTNVFFGFGSLPNPLAGIRNTAIGYYALRSNTTGGYNTAIGFQALNSNTTGSSNIANGASALCYNTTGDYNTATGAFALNNTTTGSSNTANGGLVLQFNTIGNNNTATGFQALYKNTTGSYNTTDGYQTLYNNTTGSYNVANGPKALYSNTIGNFNTAIGYLAGNSNPNNLTNSTAIGYSATATASNQVRIGNSSVTSIGGYANWSNISDGRLKKNIRANVPGLAFINSLLPVTYNLDLDAEDNLLGIDAKEKESRDSLMQSLPQDLKEIISKAREAKQKQVQTGFVAQDVEKTAKSIGYDFSGVDVDERGIYSLRYGEFVVPLVKAVQELSAQNEWLQEQINQLLGKENESSILRSANGESSITGIANPVVAQCKLHQNAPNPLTHSTVIKFYIPENINTAFLNIYNMEGKQLMQIPIAERGENSHQILGHHFSAGMYLYTLIADGTVVDTKRMILTK